MTAASIRNNRVTTDVCVNIASMDEMVEEVKHSVEEGKSFYVCTVNLDHLHKLKSDTKFQEVYHNSKFVTADGMPIVGLIRSRGGKVDRVTGADLVEPIVEMAAAHRHPLYFIGPSQDVIDKCVAQIKAKHGSVAIVGHAVPSRNFDPLSDEARGIIDDIDASGAAICFIGLGAPKQEIFAAEAAKVIEGTVFLPVGAALEFMAGNKRRAPKMFRSTGLEWLWRLGTEPARLGPRYLLNAKVLLELVYHRTIKG